MRYVFNQLATKKKKIIKHVMNKKGSDSVGVLVIQSRKKSSQTAGKKATTKQPASQLPE